MLWTSYFEHMWPDISNVPQFHDQTRVYQTLKISSEMCNALDSRIIYKITVVKPLQAFYFPINNVLQSMKIVFILTNSVDPDEMCRSVTFYLGF